LYFLIFKIIRVASYPILNPFILKLFFHVHFQIDSVSIWYLNFGQNWKKKKRDIELLFGNKMLNILLCSKYIKIFFSILYCMQSVVNEFWSQFVSQKYLCVYEYKVYDVDKVHFVLEIKIKSQIIVFKIFDYYVLNAFGMHSFYWFFLF